MTERQHPVAEVANRLGVSGHSLYAWIKRYHTPEAELQQDASQQAEIRRLKAELRRVTDERDILKKAAVAFFRMSRSILSRAFSARRRVSSICSALTGLLSAPVSRPCRWVLTQVEQGLYHPQRAGYRCNALPQPAERLPA